MTQQREQVALRGLRTYSQFYSTPSVEHPLWALSVPVAGDKLYLRPQAAAAVELDSILPDIIFTHSSQNFDARPTVTLDKLNRLKEWEYIPPLLYQLLGLTKILTCSNSH